MLGTAILLAWSFALAAQHSMTLTDGPGPTIDDPPWPDLRLDLNTAAAAELQLLPGIGARLSESIVGDREKNGPFASLDDLRRVRWIGPTTIERIRPYVVLESDERRRDDRADQSGLPNDRESGTRALADDEDST